MLLQMGGTVRIKEMKQNRAELSEAIFQINDSHIEKLHDSV